MITGSCGTIICVTQASVLGEFLSCSSRFSWLKVPSYYAPQMVMFSIQDLVAWVAWLRCSFCIWQITEVIVMAPLYWFFYLYVIFNIEIKSLDMHFEIIGVFEKLEKCLTLPQVWKKKEIFFSNKMGFSSSVKLLRCWKKSLLCPNEVNPFPVFSAAKREKWHTCSFYKSEWASGYALCWPWGPALITLFLWKILISRVFYCAVKILSVGQKFS